MKVVSYNVLDGGRDEHGTARWSDVVSLLERERPDLLGLQECNGFERDAERTLHELERALDMRGVLALAPSGYHVALLLRDAELTEVQTPREGFVHTAVRARTRIDGLSLSIVVTHLSPFSSAGRLQEAEQIAAWCAEAARDGAEALVLGDLNALSPRDAAALDPGAWPDRYRARHCLPDGTLDTRAIARLEDAGLVDLQAACSARDGQPPTPTRPTRAFAADRPVQRLDYVFASAGLAARVRECRPCEDALAERASDHRPLTAVIDPNTMAAGTPLPTS